MPLFVYAVALHVPDGIEITEDMGQELGDSIELALQEAHEQRQLPGVSHVSVDFQEIV